MKTKVVVAVETGYFKYPTVVATFYGTSVSRFWKDAYLRKSLLDAAVDAKDDKDIFDFANLIFSQVNQLVKKRYGAQDLILESVEAMSDVDNTSILVEK
jgi:hypothetical protein